MTTPEHGDVEPRQAHDHLPGLRRVGRYDPPVPGVNPPRVKRADDTSNMKPPRLCVGCGYPLAKGAHSSVRYHADCRKRFHRRRQAAKAALLARGERALAADIAAEIDRQGSWFEDEKVARLLTTDVTEATLLALRLNPGPAEELQHVLASKGLFAQVQTGQLTQADVARMLGVHPTQVSKAVAALVDTMVRIVDGETHPADGRLVEDLLFRLEPPDRDDEVACWSWAQRAADAFLTFESRYFRLTGGRHYIRKEFHRRWVVEFMFAVATGGYLQILAPPRHGKSQLMVHLCVWLIVRNPNIRILWCGPNMEIAGDFVWAVAQELDENEKMIAEMCPRGERFSPPKRGPGTTWSKKAFTVVNRDTVLVGATMQAVGARGKILSRNADILVQDDLEDQDSTAEPRLRRKTRRWSTTTWDSRKEEHTASVTIGSRQHWDDLYGYNLKDPNYRTVVDRAHSLDCTRPRSNVKLHVDCVLFPEVRSYRWLYSKMTGSAARSGSDAGDDANLFDLVYQNLARRSASSYWTEDLCASAHNRGRRWGLAGLAQVPEEGRRLVASLDPSASGFQAAVLVALTPHRAVTPTVDAYQDRLTAQDWTVKRWLVDTNNRRGGGLDEALEQMKAWLAEYQCRHWVIEDMAMQKSFTTDPRIVQWARAHEVHLEGHVTNENKYDAAYGVGSMVRLWRADLVDVPYGDDEAQRLADEFDAQFLTFDGQVDTEKRRIKDLQMAFWFQQKVARRYEQEIIAEREDQVEHTTDGGYDYPLSYPGMVEVGYADFEEPPWRR